MFYYQLPYVFGRQIVFFVFVLYECIISGGMAHKCHTKYMIFKDMIFCKKNMVRLLRGLSRFSRGFC